jgi:hypothetical protein
MFTIHGLANKQVSGFSTYIFPAAHAIIVINACQ